MSCAVSVRSRTATHFIPAGGAFLQTAGGGGGVGVGAGPPPGGSGGSPVQSAQRAASAECADTRVAARPMKSAASATRIVLEGVVLAGVLTVISFGLLCGLSGWCDRKRDRRRTRERRHRGDPWIRP